MANNNSGGIGLPSLLTVGFIMLKLTEVIDWRWIWVLCPIWISLASLALLTIVALFYHLFID